LAVGTEDDSVARPRLEAIVLAGGAGTRFGGGKLLAPWRDGRLIDGALGAAFAAPVTRVVLVTGADPGVGEVARTWARAQGQEPRLRHVHAHDHAEGMGASLRTGVAALADDTQGAFVFLADMPAIPHDVAARLARELESGALAAAPRFQGRRGHPALFARALFPDLLHASGDAGARGIFQRLGERLALVDVDAPGVLIDVDTRDDLRDA
jgi:molybdenum cofactor cytidylyltransferase